VTPLGGAPGHGDLRGVELAAPVVAVAPTPSGAGYWLLAGDGGLFTFGDASFHGSTGGMRLNRPVVGMAATPSGGGYWLVASDGGIFTFGDASFHGSTGGMRLNRPVVGMAATPSGGGYWSVASDGGIFAFGDAPFHGSAAADRVDPVVGMAASGAGYLVAAADGDVRAYGTPAPGSLLTACKDQAVVAVAGRPGGGAWLASSPVPPALPSADPLDWVAAESAQLATVLRLRQGCQAAATPGPGRLANPLPGARVTTGYGFRIHPIFGRLQFHTGLDLAGGPRVIAPAGGIVVEVRDRGGYGLTVVVDHGDGVATVHGHLARAAVGVHQQVAAGQELGTVGQSGFATGVHLHFEVRVKGEPTDPGRWIG
jgi:murein DD-endopeptidase MepM/ murein hydrolase activator NlpD